VPFFGGMSKTDWSLSFTNILSPSGMIGRAEGANTYYYLKDHLGSVRTTVNTSGTAVAYEDFYPFGKRMPGRSSGSTGDYKFTGHERDEEAGLTLDYMMARNYDPEIGRFLQIDPLQEFSSPYTYVGNNPLGYTDPTGMSSCGSSYVTFCGSDGEMIANFDDWVKDQQTGNYVYYWDVT
jgi:RHS repeat-associated protein